MAGSRTSIAPETLAVMRRFLRESNRRHRIAHMPEAQARVRSDGSIDLAPSSPGKVTTAAAADGVAVMWKPAHDDDAVRGYRIYRDGKPIATVRDTTWFVDRTGGGAHQYSVRAIDSGGMAGGMARVSTAGAAPAAAPAAAGSAAPTPPAAAAGTAGAAAQKRVANVPAPSYSDMKSTSPTEFRLEWHPVPNAVAYGIYQDGKLLGHVKQPSFAAALAQSAATIQVDAVLASGARTAPAPAVTLARTEKDVRIAALDGVPIEQLAAAMQARQAGAPAAAASAPAATPPAG